LLVLLLGAGVVGLIEARAAKMRQWIAAVDLDDRIDDIDDIDDIVSPRPEPVRPVVRDPIEGPDVRMDAIDRRAFGTGDARRRRTGAPLRVAHHRERLRSQRVRLVEQCTRDRCANAFPVVFSELGSPGSSTSCAIASKARAESFDVPAEEPPCVVRLRTETTLHSSRLSSAMLLRRQGV